MCLVKLLYSERAQGMVGAGANLSAECLERDGARSSCAISAMIIRLAKVLEFYDTKVAGVVFMPNTRRKTMRTWKKPVIVETSCGCEVSTYANAHI